jgi:hypothetical protein
LRLAVASAEVVKIQGGEYAIVNLDNAVFEATTSFPVVEKSVQLGKGEGKAAIIVVAIIN